MKKSKTTCYQSTRSLSDLDLKISKKRRFCNFDDNPDHTLAHETAHVFLTYDMSVNPSDNGDESTNHDAAGGVFFYRKLQQNGDIAEDVKPINQANIDLILKTLPEIESKLPDSKLPGTSSPQPDPKAPDKK